MPRIKKTVIISGTLFLIFAAVLLFPPAFSDRENKPGDQSLLSNISANTKEIIDNIGTTLSPNTRERINILILGMSGPGHNAPYLTDTILVASVNPKKSEVVLISIPRDLWVKIPRSNTYSRINSVFFYGKNKSYQNGVELAKEAAEQVTGLEIPYYALIDLDGVSKAVDALGGINVLVVEDIDDRSFPGPNNTYQRFTLKKGWRYLNGETAAKYVRTRHVPRGDFRRIRRQQQVLEALKAKILALNPIWDTKQFLTIINILKDNLTTNIGIKEAQQLWKIGKDIKSENMRNLILETGLNPPVLRGVQMGKGEAKASVLIPVKGIGRYEQIQELINNFINETDSGPGQSRN